jgi:hypothetical protein
MQGSWRKRGNQVRGASSSHTFARWGGFPHFGIWRATCPYIFCVGIDFRTGRRKMIAEKQKAPLKRGRLPAEAAVNSLGISGNPDPHPLISSLDNQAFSTRIGRGEPGWGARGACRHQGSKAAKPGPRWLEGAVGHVQRGRESGLIRAGCYLTRVPTSATATVHRTTQIGIGCPLMGTLCLRTQAQVPGS